MSVNVHIIEVDDLTELEYAFQAPELSSAGILGRRFVDLADVVLVHHRGEWHSVKPPWREMPVLNLTTEKV